MEMLEKWEESYFLRRNMTLAPFFKVTTLDFADRMYASSSQMWIKNDVAHSIALKQVVEHCLYYLSWIG